MTKAQTTISTLIPNLSQSLPEVFLYNILTDDCGKNGVILDDRNVHYDYS